MIRDGQRYRRTGLSEESAAEATKILRAYTSRAYGEDAAQLIGPPVGTAPKRDVDKATVYFIGNGSAVKIGMAVHVLRRFESIQSCCPQELFIYGVVPGGLAVERQLHSRFCEYRIHGEWFRIEGRLQAFLRGLPDISQFAGFRVESPAQPHTSARLSPLNIAMIRQNPAGLSGREFARLFGVSESTVSQIKNGIWWKDEDAA